jgi:hypothetical protein
LFTLASPIDANLYHSSSNNRHSAYIETLEASKKLTRPTSAISMNGNEISKQTQPYRNLDQASRPSTISLGDIPLFESILSKDNSSTSVHHLGGISSTITSGSPVCSQENINEIILFLFSD